MQATPRIKIGCAALALALIGGACGSDDSSSSSDDTADKTQTTPPAAYGGSLVIGTEAEVDSFLPGSARWGSSALFVAKAVYDPLTAFDEDGVAQPYLAESIEPVDDTFMAWDITLREGITFHDGAPLDADALLVNLQQVMIESALTKNVFRPVESVEVTGPLTVRVNLKTPWAHLPGVLANQTGFIVSPTMYETDNTTEPLGTGPFVYESWEPDVEFVAKRYEDYWQSDAEGNKLPYLDQVTFHPTPDATSRLQALEAGDLSLIQSQSATQIEDFENGDIPGGITVLLDESEGTEENVIFNCTTGVFSDPALRRAAAHAVDRQSMVDDLFGGIYVVANGPFGEDSGWGQATEYPGYDPELATEEVDAWKAANGGSAPSVTVSVLPGTENDLIARYLQEQWEAVGFDVEIATLEEAAGTSAMVSGDFEALIFSFWDRPDPDGLYHYWYGDPESSLLNFANYESQTVNDALDKARAIENRDERQAEYQKIWDEFAAEVPMLFLYHVRWALAFQDSIYGVGEFTLPSGQPAQPIVYGNTFLTGVWTTG